MLNWRKKNYPWLRALGKATQGVALIIKLVDTSFYIHAMRAKIRRKLIFLKGGRKLN